MLRMLQEERLPLWQAVAARLLDLWAFEGEVMTALMGALQHPAPMVRAAAARSLEPVAQQHVAQVEKALEPLLEDPIRQVRVHTAWAMRHRVDEQSRAGRDLQRFLEYNCDQPTGLLQVGLYQMSRQELEPALDSMQRAIQWDPNSPPLRHEYAVMLSMAGRNQEAVRQLEEACRLAPGEAEYCYKLGLAWNEVNRLEETLRALQRAVVLNPRHGRAWYNLGLAHNASGQPEAALEALRKAEEASPTDPRIPYARATIFMNLQRFDEARLAALRALELEKDYAPAAQLLRALP